MPTALLLIRIRTVCLSTLPGIRKADSPAFKVTNGAFVAEIGMVSEEVFPSVHVNGPSALPQPAAL